MKNKIICLLILGILSLSFIQINVLAYEKLDTTSDFWLTDGELTPEHGRSGTKFTFRVKYINTNDVGPELKFVFIKIPYSGWVFFEMEYEKGVYSDGGATYKLEKRLSMPGDYKYYFLFGENNGKCVRLPTDSDKSFSGPRVIGSRSVEHFAVIVCGGMGDGDRGQEAFERSATHVHDALRDKGYKDSNIYHLRKDTSNSRVDGYLDRDSVKYALDTWLPAVSNKDSKCLVYLCGHGSPYGSLFIDENLCINDFEVAEWISGLEYKTLTVLVECCYAGQFIDDLSGNNRIIITSTNKDLSAYGVTYDEMFFTKLFFDAIEDGRSYGGAWEAADKSISDSLSSEDAVSLDSINVDLEEGQVEICDNEKQIPLIDDNGDGIGHGTAEEDDLPLGGDGSLAKITYPGYDHDSIFRGRFKSFFISFLEKISFRFDIF